MFLAIFRKFCKYKVKKKCAKIKKKVEAFILFFKFFHIKFSKYGKKHFLIVSGIYLKKVGENEFLVK